MTRRRLVITSSFKEPEIRFTLRTRTFTQEQTDAGKKLFKRLIDRALKGNNLSLENGIGSRTGEARMSGAAADGMNKNLTKNRTNESGSV